MLSTDKPTPSRDQPRKASNTEVRKQLLARGYKILPNRGKVPAILGWNTPEYIVRELTSGPKGTVVNRVARWERRFPDAQSTGVRVEDGLVAIDIDVDDADIVGKLLSVLAGIAPDVCKRAPTRRGGGQYKVALFARLAKGEEAFVRLASHRYINSSGKDHCVEVFGGKPRSDGRCNRQFGVYGPHSYNEDGSVAAEYLWVSDRPALHEVSIKKLPTITRAQASALIDKFDAMATTIGWERSKKQLPDTGGTRAVYDIDSTTLFDTDSGRVRIDYEQLCDEYYSMRGGGLRCSSNFLSEYRGATKNTRCMVGDENRHGCVGVYVFGDDEIHYPVWLERDQLLLLPRESGKETLTFEEFLVRQRKQLEKIFKD